MTDFSNGGSRDAAPKTTCKAGAALVSLALAAMLAACGGGNGGTAAAESADGADRMTAQATKPPKAKAAGAATATHADAFRLLTQASMGATEADVAHVMAIGPAAWIDEQFAIPVRAHHLARWNADNAVVAGGALPNNVNSSFFQEAITSDDQLRQRVTFALSQIFVVSMQDNALASYKSQGVASYMDMLAQNSFGNYRTLLSAVSLHPSMGVYLSSMANRGENLKLGRIPDQNFAREVMQLFSIGLVNLNLDGSAKPGPNGGPSYTYTPDDIDGLSKVFTGFSWAGPDTDSRRFNNNPDMQAPYRYYTPMQPYPQYHSISEKRFLGAVVAAQQVANPMLSFNTAMDTLAAHPNVGPFLAKQLIQRLVTSNPSPAYVARVATVFNDNGSGTRGDLKAVVKAILLDNEARDPAKVNDPGFGKLREPVLRLTAFLRAYKATSDSGLYLICGTDDPGSQLAQSALRSPTVFNFYRPEHVNAGGATEAHGLVAPETQITTESSVAGYVNYMMATVNRGTGLRGLDGMAARSDVQPDFSAATPLANDSAALVEEFTSRLLGDNVNPSLKSTIQTAVDSIVVPALNKTGTNAGYIAIQQRNRVYTAALLTLASPEYITQK